MASKKTEFLTLPEALWGFFTNLLETNLLEKFFEVTIQFGVAIFFRGKHTLTIPGMGRIFDELLQNGYC
jgi:hypothetical protein